MNKTEEKYEKICTTWEEMNLQNVCAREAAAKLGVSPITLVIALKTRRPGAYNPNKFKGRKPRVYIYILLYSFYTFAYMLHLNV